MLEYRLILGPYIVDNVDSTDNENAEIINFDIPDKVMFFKKKNYMVQDSVKITSNVFRPAVRVFDTGDGPNLIQTSFLPPEWRQKIKLVTGIRYLSASDGHIKVYGTLSLFICLGDFRVCLRFGVSKNLAVPNLTITSNVDRFIESIFPMMEQMIVPVHSGSGAILSAYAPAVMLNKTFDIGENTPQLSGPLATLL